MRYVGRGKAYEARYMEFRLEINQLVTGYRGYKTYSGY